MLTLPPSVRVFVAAGATDMRLGMDGLSALARSRLGLVSLISLSEGGAPVS
jgi:hypothetical protein